jgi:proteic killer suppression protein
MNVGFKTTALANLYTKPLEDHKGKQKYSKEVLKQYKKKVIILMTVETLKELQTHRGLRFEHLKGKLRNYCSIRLNKQFRLILKVIEKKDRLEIQVEEVEIIEISKHYE